MSLLEWPPPLLHPTPEFREPCWRFVGPSADRERISMTTTPTPFLPTAEQSFALLEDQSPSTSNGSSVIGQSL